MYVSNGNLAGTWRVVCYLVEGRYSECPLRETLLYILSLVCSLQRESPPERGIAELQTTFSDWVPAVHNTFILWSITSLYSFCITSHSPPKEGHRSPKVLFLFHWCLPMAPSVRPTHNSQRLRGQEPQQEHTLEKVGVPSGNTTLSQSVCPLFQNTPPITSGGRYTPYFRTHTVPFSEHNNYGLFWKHPILTLITPHK